MNTKRERRLKKLAASAPVTYGAYVLHGLAHPHMLRTGASADEARADMPGDLVVPNPDWKRTFAIDIAAPPRAIWPWLAQMGYGRAGWYTWYRHDNGGVPSAWEIVPELQDLDLGHVIPDGPRADAGFGRWRVAVIVAPNVLVLHSRRDPFTGREVDDPDAEDGLFVDTTWAFQLEERGDLTRLVVRVRAKVHGRTGRATIALVRALVGVGDMVMERSLLEGIRARVEAHA